MGNTTAIILIAVIVAAAVFAAFVSRNGGVGWLWHRSIGTTCPDCRGMGSTEANEVCPTCNGRRFIWTRL